MSWFNAIALRAVVIGLIGGADVGAVAGAPLAVGGILAGMLFGAVAGLPISLACARAAALDISTSTTPRGTAGAAFARPARTGSAVLSVLLALLSGLAAGPIGALMLAGNGLLLVTPLAAMIARAAAPWCLAEAVPRIDPARKWLVGTAFAAPIGVAAGASFGWLLVP
jgi:hypothetical protein